jgi:hypothetical protein
MRLLRKDGVCVALGISLLFCGAAAGVEATAILTGIVINAATGQPVPGASLRLEGAEVECSSDVNGVFRLTAPPGDWGVVVTRDGFQAQRVTEIAVTAGSVNDLSVVLHPAGGSATADLVEEITVTAEASDATEAALLAERKRAVQISDAIGSAEISRNAGSDAAGALQRVTGISLQESKYVYVRGLGDRYSNSSVNGSKMPSTEFESKTVPMDLFPADLIDRITVSKSYTADKPGDFVAGFVELSTLDFPTRQRGAIGASVGYNTATTSEPYLRYPGGGALGFSGSGGQSLPASIPEDALFRRSAFTGQGFTVDELEQFGEELIGIWTPERTGGAPYGGGFNFSYGNSFERFGLVVSATYDDHVSTRTDEVQTIFRVAGAEGGVAPDSSYLFDTTDDKVRQAYTATFGYRLGSSHQVKLRGLETTLSTTESRFQEGFFSDTSGPIEDYRLSYLEQDVLNLQLAGDHFLAGVGAGAVLDWRITRADATTEENRRETLYRESSTPGVFVLTTLSQSGFMFFNDLEDRLVDTAVNWESLLNFSSLQGGIKAGIAYTDSDRSLVARRLRFLPRNTRDVDLTLPAEQIFTEENIDPRIFEIVEGTRPTDTYDGLHEVSAGYVQADLGLGRWRLIAGLRVEDSEQQVLTLNRLDPTDPPIESTLANTDLLPALNLVYQLGESSNLRFSASQTVNRPEFRELAPFRFLHVAGGFTAVGNPSLVRAKISSFDARWEWFPSSGEVVAASVFFKDFEDPIEAVLLGGAEPVESWANAEGAQNRGVEIEVRRRLGNSWSKLDGWTAIVNYAFVDSEIEIDPATTVFTNPTRALLGQPDNVVNAILEWDRPTWGSTVRILYNWTDDKVFRGGGIGLPDAIEEARGTLDVVWRQSLDRVAQGLSIKLAGKNLTDEEHLWTQGGEVFRLYESGRSASLSVGYSFF